MIQKKTGRTDQEWLKLIKECHTSGQTDKEWCREHHISPSNFYYHIRRLRKKAYTIPETSFSGKINLRQEVVPVDIQEESPANITEVMIDPSSYLAGSHAASAIRIRFRNIQLDILNGADSDVIKAVLSAAGSLC